MDGWVGGWVGDVAGEDDDGGRRELRRVPMTRLGCLALGNLFLLRNAKGVTKRKYFVV